MKIMSRTLSLILGILFFAGCSSCPCKKSAEPVQAAVAPVAAPAVPAPAVAAPEEPAEASIPVKTRKYVSK